MKKLLSFSLLITLSLSVSISAQAYRDIAPSSNIAPAIDYFIDQGILAGEGFFRSEETIPVGWFWEILLEDAGFNPTSATFETELPTGVDPDSTLAQYVREAVRRDFIDPSIPFDKTQPIRRADAIKYIIKTKGILAPQNTSTKFRNLVAGVPPTAQYLNAFEAAFASEIITAADLNPLQPHENLKRKDFVQWLYNWHNNGEQKVSGLIQSSRSEIQYPYQKRDGSSVSIGPSTRVTQTQTRNREIAVLEEVLKQIEAQYRFGEEITDENQTDWINHGIEAVVEQLDDKYSSYIRPEKAEDFIESLEGSFEGIGAYVEMIDEQFTIRSPIKGSPAEAAGLLPGDIVLEVDGEDIAGQTINEIIAKVKGPAGSEVKLTIKRNNSQINQTIIVIRGEITVPDVTIEYKNGIPIIGIHQFQRDTLSHIEKIMADKDILGKKPKGIIFDLRNNPGGFLTSAVDVGGLFVEKGKVIFSTDYRDTSRNTVYRAEADGALKGYQNLVFLQNKGSASASEILNGMIQDHGVGTIIGETSVGKGTVQSILNFVNGGNLKITVAKWLTPNGRWINDIGVIPDIEITSPTAEEKIQKVDRQLDRAVQRVLQGR